MKTVAVVQARLKSTRLPGKILLPLPTGRVVLEEVIRRCRDAQTVHQVVVAIPDDEECDILLPYTMGATVVRGPELDVLERYRRAAETVGAHVVVRVTSDCPMIPPQMIDEVVRQRNAHALSYACNNMPDTWPIGYACEAFSIHALRYQAENSWDASSREHVTTALRSSAKGVSHVNVPCPHGDYSHLRWTLDTIEDYVRIVTAMERMRDADDLLGAFIADTAR